MKSRTKILLDNSLGAALSAIEIYNKPNFIYREENFSTLLINAWELLFKAKILKDNGNNIKSILKYDGRHIKRNRSGNPMTINIHEAYGKISNLDDRLKENLDEIISIRDTATHFYNESKTLSYLMFTLGTACLRNYHKCCRDWFSVGLEKYNFFILPMSFNWDFKNISSIDIEKEPSEIVNILNSISRKQSKLKLSTSANDYIFISEIKITLVSAKKIEKADVVAKVDNLEDSVNFIEKEVNKLDRYPYSFTQILAEAKNQNPKFSRNKLSKFIRERKIKGNIEYHDYIYTTKKNEMEKKNPSNNYNRNFLQLVVSDSYFK